MRRSVLLVLLTFGTPLLHAAADGGWLKKVPDNERQRVNPYSTDPTAVTAGGILYRRSCASCHGKDAGGIGSRPSLLTTRVHEASDGELHWLLTNGNLAKGMPSWSRLPDAQRWQIIRYVHSLPLQ